jgi:hypothetical protein
VSTSWVAFLDDDDELLPPHLDALLTHACTTGADVIYPGCIVLDPAGREVPRRDEWGRFGREFDAELLRKRSYVPVTSLARTSLARLAGFGAPTGSNYDDWGFYLRMLDLGAMFSHLPEITWYWHHHGKNSSGQPGKGDA